MRLSKALILSFFVLSSNVRAATDMDESYILAIGCGFSASDQRVLKDAWDEARQAHPSIDPKAIVATYHKWATPSMEASDLACLLKALGQTPQDNWDALPVFVSQCIQVDMDGPDKARAIHATALLCSNLAYKQAAMDELKTRYQALMLLVMTNFEPALVLTSLSQKMKAGQELQPDEEYQGVLAQTAVGTAHSRVFKSLVDLYLSPTPAEERDGSGAFCCHFFPHVDAHPYMTRVDIVEIVNTFGILSQRVEGLTDRFISDSQGKSEQEQMELMFNLITDEMIAGSTLASNINDYLKTFFPNVRNPSVFARRALVEALMNDLPEDHWNDFRDSYRALFDVGMHCFIGADTISCFAPVYARLVSSPGALKEYMERASAGKTKQMSEHLGLLRLLSTIYTQLPDAAKRQTSQARATKWFGSPNTSMEAAFASVAPVFDTLEADTEANILAMWNETKPSIHPSQQPKELSKLLRQHQLNKLGKFLSSLPNS